MSLFGKKDNWWDKWEEAWPVGSKVTYMGIEMTIESNYHIHSDEYVLTCVYVDKVGRINREIFDRFKVELLTKER